MIISTTPGAEEIPKDFACTQNEARATKLDELGVPVFKATDVLSRKKPAHFFYYPGWIDALLNTLLTIKAPEPYFIVKAAFADEGYRNALDATYRLGGAEAVATFIGRDLTGLSKPRPALPPEEARRTVAEVDKARSRPRRSRGVGGPR